MAGLFFTLFFFPVSAHATGYSWSPSFNPSASSTVKASDINEIRNAILFMENQCGMPPTTLATVQVGDTVQATTMTTFRARVIALYTARGVLPLPTWSGGGGNTTIAPGTTIRAADLVSLRTALDNPALIAACAGGNCGNGTIQAGEQCDDGGTVPGDGCNATCQCEYTWNDDNCGDAPCQPSEMHQTAVDPDGAGACAASTRCVSDPVCGGGNAIHWYLIGQGGGNGRLVVDKGGTSIFDQQTPNTASTTNGTLSNLTGVHNITASWSGGSGNIIQMRVCSSSGTELDYANNIWLNPTPPPDSFHTFSTQSMPHTDAPYTVYVTSGNQVPPLCSGSGTLVQASNTSLNVNLVTSDIDSVVVPFPGGYPIVPGAPNTSTMMNLASPTVSVHVSWTGGDITGQHITVYDTQGAAQCTLVQQGDPDPQETFAGVNTTGAGSITIEVGDGPCVVCNNNSVQDNGETGVDCGGGGCPACGVACYIFPGNMSLCTATECCVPDPVNGAPYEICTSSCGTCGDGNLDPAEDCDDGPANGPCPAICSNSCVLNGGCGGGGGCGGVYATCFVADTKVTMADGSMKNIQDVQIGDILKGETGDNTVQAFHQPKLSGQVYSFNGGRYFVTEEHPFKTTDGWKSLNPEKTALEHAGITVTQLAVGDTLITDRGPVKLESVEGREEPADTKLYNFMLSGDRTYYADGYLVHNKVACSGDGSGDPQCPGTIPCLTSGGLAIPPMDPTGGTCALPCGVPTSNPGSFCASNPTSNFCDADLYMHKCAGNTCTPPSCNNNSVQDNGETGVDCGGGGCPVCPVCIPDGAVCSTNYTTCAQGIQVDCAAECCSNTFHTRPVPSCAGTEDVCGPATCTDNIQNGTETGVDCGGTCPPCGTCHTVGELDVNCGAGERCCIDPGGVPDGVHGGTYNICSVTCPTCTNSVQDQDETGVDCGGTYCPPCGTPECWGCFNPIGTPSGVYCSSDGTPAQTNACISSCSMPYHLPAQVPLSYCSSGCGPITASVGDLANICNTYYDLYYASPDTGFQVGNFVFTDTNCTTPVSGTAIRDGGGTVYNMSGNEIGPPTGNTC